jgi:glutamine amidotransferase-like uncharacterized protein
MRILFLSIALSLSLPGIVGLVEACTTAVISGKVTIDGRPLLWKNRDTSATLHNEVIIIEGSGYRAVAVVDAGKSSSVWMGSNAAGFCIENSLSRDLKGDEEGELPATVASSKDQESQQAPTTSSGLGNGSFMKLALERCATVEDFRKLLEETNLNGRSTVANFGVIDAHGGAAMFETGPHSYTMFDANDPVTAPKGYVVRSNFATTAQQLPANPEPSQVAEIYAGERYLRACQLLESKFGDPNQSEISLAFLLKHMTRDMSDETGTPHPGSVNRPDGVLPPIVSTERTISRTTTVSAAVFHGVRANEDPRLTTMWTILGDPKFSVAVPCWASVDVVADDLTDPRGAELGEIAITLRDWSMTPDRTGIRTKGLPGIWKDIFPVEQALVAETLAMRDSWQQKQVTTADMTAFHHSMAARAMAAMNQELLEAKLDALSAPETIRVAIYDHSEASASGPKNLLKFLTPENGFVCQRVRPEDIRAGQLDGYEVLIVPGGSGSKQAEMLEEAGCSAIRDFVEAGGGYIGICAGSYLASAQYSWSLNLINARVWDRAHWARGTGTVSIGLSTTGQAAFDQTSTVIDVYYGQGPLLVPGEHSALPQYEVLATYQTEVADKGAPVGAMTGTHAIVRSQFGQGRVMCFSPHPESSGGPNTLITAGVRWVAAKTED